MQKHLKKIKTFKLYLKEVLFKDTTHNVLQKTYETLLFTQVGRDVKVKLSMSF